MLKLNAGAFVATISITTSIERALIDAKDGPLIKEWRPDEAITPKGFLSEKLTDLKKHLTDLDAPFTLLSLNRILAEIESGKCTNDTLLTRIRIVHGRLRDELDTKHVYVMADDVVKYLEDQALAETAVVTAFPSATYDLGEAGKCLAFRRATACVTHLMRALEVSLGAMAKPFDVSADRTNWQNILDQIESRVTKMDATYGLNWKDDQAFYSKAVTYFRVLKDGWRNHAMHVRAKYTEEEAEDIYRAVRSFMRHLATKISEVAE